MSLTEATMIVHGEYIERRLRPLPPPQPGELWEDGPGGAPVEIQAVCNADERSDIPGGGRVVVVSRYWHTDPDRRATFAYDDFLRRFQLNDG